MVPQQAEGRRRRKEQPGGLGKLTTAGDGDKATQAWKF